MLKVFISLLFVTTLVACATIEFLDISDSTIDPDVDITYIENSGGEMSLVLDGAATDMSKEVCVRWPQMVTVETYAGSFLLERINTPTWLYYETDAERWVSPLTSALPLCQKGTKIRGVDSTGFNYQGSSVAINAIGSRMVVGADGDVGPGAAHNYGAFYVFERSNDTWVQQGPTLYSTNSTGLAHQGSAIAMDAEGVTIVECGNIDNTMEGACWVFEEDSTSSFSETAMLTRVPTAPRTRCGSSVDIDAAGQRIVMGCFDYGNASAQIEVYDKDESSIWQYAATLSTNGTLGTGQAVAISGSGRRVAVGCPGASWINGTVWVFELRDEGWTVIDVVSADDIIGFAYFGFSVDLDYDGMVLVVGGHEDDSGVGAVWVFSWSHVANAYVRESKLVKDMNGTVTHQGKSVATNHDGSIILTGSGGTVSITESVWVYQRGRTGGWVNWKQLTPSDSVGYTAFGDFHSLALADSGHAAIIGGTDDNMFRGAVWYFA